MSEGRSTVQALVDALNRHDLDALDSVFTDDVILEWPQSNERIVGNANRREIYSRFPGLPKVSNERVREVGDLVVLEADLDYDDGSHFRTVFIFEMRHGLISRETAYWSQPFPAPEWRAAWVEPLRP